MFQVCLHGRGGQGVVTASEMLAQAAFTEGRQVQSFPNFGSERMGAPVLGYVRIDDSPITTHEPIQIPDAVIIQDPTLVTALPVFNGLDPETGFAVINTVHPADAVKAEHDDAPEHTVTIPADAIVREYLGQNKPSAAMLGAFAAATGTITLDSIIEAFESRFKGAVANGNVAAAKVAYEMVKNGWTPPQPGPGFSEELEAQIIEIGAGLGLADDEGVKIKMPELIEGSHAVATVVARSRPGVVCAYPISPQTHIVEELSAKVRTGELKDCTYLNVESEFAAMSVAIGSSAAGARTYTATASQGLLYMAEAVYNATGMELPIVMTVASRAIGSPINIWNDHSDSLSQRDSGWLQLFAADNQEAADLHVQAFKIAETLRLPVMVCMDGFVLTHATEMMELPTQEEIDEFLPPASWIKADLDIEHPATLGTMAGPEFFMETKYLAFQDQLRAPQVVEDVGREWEAKFGRPAGGRIRVYVPGGDGKYHPKQINTGDADSVRGQADEVIMIMMGSTLGTMQARLPQLEAEGVKVKSVGITSFRPFPDELLKEVIGDATNVVVIDRALQPGIGGVLTNEVDRALVGTNARVKTVMSGLGGRAITEENLVDVARMAARGELTDRLNWLGLKPDLIESSMQHHGTQKALVSEQAG